MTSHSRLVSVILLAVLGLLEGTRVVGNPSEILLPPDMPIAEAIDGYIETKLSASSVTPAPPAADAKLLRRLTLDLAGRIPTRRELHEYLNSIASDKHTQSIDRLMGSRWYVHHLASVLNDMLRGLGNDGPDLRPYLITAVHERRPWDRMFRELMGTRPDPQQPQQFVQGRLGDLDLLTRDTSTIFFGVNISCAQCHVHPYVETLTQDHFFGMKAFFARSYVFEDRLLERKFGQPHLTYATNEGENRNVGMMFLNGQNISTPEVTVQDLAQAMADEQKRIDELKKKNEERNKKKEQDASAAVGEIEYPSDAEFSFRAQLVETALSQQNRQMFGRAIVNRIWHHFLGFGLVMRIDQMHDANPPSHPELLDWLTRDLLEHDFDLHRLIRGILASRTYARGGHVAADSQPAAKELFAAANLRVLTPQQFGVSALICGDPAWDRTDMEKDEADRLITDVQTRANQLFGEVISPISDDTQISASEALTISNDPDRLQAMGEKLVARVVGIRGRTEQLKDAVESVLSRPITLEEAVTLTEYLTKMRPEPSAPDNPQSQAEAEKAVWQQAIWALMTSTEFRFNH